MPVTLPAWCDRFLRDPADDFFASRTWYDTLLSHALPAGSVAEPLAADEAVLWPMLRTGRRIAALTTPYTLSWRPLPAPPATEEEVRRSGFRLGGTLRLRAPVRLDAVDADAPGLAAALGGLRAAGIAVLRHDHFGNWHEEFPAGTSWDDYLAGRDPALRTTVRRKLSRHARETRFDLLDAPGAALEEGIAAYEDVRARSWKPHEPFPDFDAALIRAAAGEGVLRLGVLRDGGTGVPVAAQYWVVSGGRAWLLKLAHDESRRAASPGTVLTALMIQGLLDGERVRELDFGRGDDPYKSLWVRSRRQRIGLTLASPFHPAGLLAIARHAAGRARRRLAARRTGTESGPKGDQG